MSKPPDRISPSAHALFLDVDGTLVDLQEHPGSVFADGELIRLIQAASSEIDGALALVSGRSLAEIDRMFDPVKFNAAGAHGSEVRISGERLQQASVDALPDDVVQSIEDFASANDRLLVEKKSTGVSLHYRRAPELETECRARVKAIVAALGDAYRLIDGKMVLEIAPRAHSKGAAIRAFLDHESFGQRRPIFIGDDVTDEDGFRAVNELDGVSVRVGDNRSSAARYALADVEAVRHWLAVALSN